MYAFEFMAFLMKWKRTIFLHHLSFYFQNNRKGKFTFFAKFFELKVLFIMGLLYNFIYKNVTLL